MWSLCSSMVFTSKICIFSWKKAIISIMYDVVNDFCIKLTISSDWKKGLTFPFSLHYFLCHISSQWTTQCLIIGWHTDEVVNFANSFKFVVVSKLTHSKDLLL